MAASTTAAVWDGLPAVMGPGHLARMLAECGRFDEGILFGRKALEAGEALDHPASLVMACWGLGRLYNIRGAFDQAVPLLERAHAIATRWELSNWLANVPEELGFAYACSGRLAEGVRLLEESLRAYEALGRHPLAVHMGEAYLRAGRSDESRAFAEKTLAIARRLGQRRLEALARYLLGEVGSQGDLAAMRAALDWYLEALGLAEVLGMRPVVAHCHLGLGKLARCLGDVDRAREHLAAATAMYREMCMGFWLEKAAG